MVRSHQVSFPLDRKAINAPFRVADDAQKKPFQSF